MFIRTLFSLVVMFSIISVAMGDVPNQLHYNGFATDGAGDPMNCPNAIECATSFDLKFRVYSEAEGGAVFWEETHSAVSFYSGSFHVVLGTVTPIDATLLDGDRWLGVKVNDNEEMLPRQKLLSAAYAIRAGTVENAENAAQLGGLNPEAYASADSVTELQTIIAGTDDDTLAALGCAPGQVAKASDEGWVCADDIDTDTTIADTNTQLTETQVDEMVANNGYAQQDQVTGLDATVTGLQAEIQTAINTLTNLQSDLGDLTTVTQGNSTSIVVLQSALTAAQTSLATAESAINNLGSDLSLVQSDVGNLQTSVANLTTALTGVQSDLAAHQADPDAHHSSLSDSLHIVPSSVTIKGTDTRLTAGELDLGSEVDDHLSAPIVQTLTNGGDADSLHIHASAGGGGGGCYTAIGIDTCTDGYSLVYQGKMVVGGGSDVVCLALEAFGEYGYTSTPYPYLREWGRAGPILGSFARVCALCCP
jgi:hypothetical protein